MSFNIFSGVSPFVVADAKARYHELIENNAFLIEISNKKTKIKPSEKEKFEDLAYSLDEVLKFNEKVDDEYAQFDVKHIQKLFLKVNNKLGVDEVGITKYKKDRLKEILTANIFGLEYKSIEAEMMSYYPEDYDKKLRKEGNWVMIINHVPVGVDIPMYNIYYATPTTKSTKRGDYYYKLHFAAISVEGQEVLLNPHEYSIMKDGNELLKGVGTIFEMRDINGKAPLDPVKSFYMKSRGFDQSSLYRILFKSIKSKAFCYFVTMPKYCEIMDLQKTGINFKFASAIVENKHNRPTFKLVTHA